MVVSSSDIGALVRSARKHAGRSMNDLAAAAGTSVSTVSRIESGTFDPRWSTVEAVMTALGTTVDREREREQNLKRARYRDRIGNIFSAAQLVAPSYDPVELWTLLEGTSIGGKPIAEELAARAVARAYDQALTEDVPTRSGSFADAVRLGHDSTNAGTPLAEAIARMAAALTAWTGLRLAIPRNAAHSITTIEDAARYATTA